MLRRSLFVLAAASFAVFAAGCGSRSTKPYTAAGSAPCIAKKGFTGVTTNSVKVGFIAGFADNGGLKAKAPDGNVVTIAFAADDTAGVESTRAAFKTHAPPKLRPHIDDIMDTKGNAVLVWTTTPPSQELALVEGCLHS
jgi:hypothetical protein